MLSRIWAKRRAVLVYACLLGAGWYLGTLLLGYVIPASSPEVTSLFGHVMMAGLIIFLITAAIPFVPGAEIGFAILMFFGADAALAVYTCMVGALALSFCVARFLPATVLAGALDWMRLIRAAELVRRIETAEPLERMALLSQSLPGWLGPRLIRNRYVALALAINIPGNTVVGGGGGLAFLAGASGIYSFGAFLITILIAVAPVPLAFWLLA